MVHPPSQCQETIETALSLIETPTSFGDLGQQCQPAHVAPLVLVQQAEKVVALASLLIAVGPDGAVGLFLCFANHGVRKGLTAFLAGEGLLSCVGGLQLPSGLGVIVCPLSPSA